jgi:hypothetical protein
MQLCKRLYDDLKHFVFTNVYLKTRQKAVVATLQDPK